MKKVTTILKAMLMMVVVLVIAQACVPNGGGGGTPTPNPQIDSSVIYYLENKLVVNFDNLNFLSSLNSSFDFDKNGVDDIQFSSYTNFAAVTNISSLDSNKFNLGIKDFTNFTGDGYQFTLNDIISNNNFQLKNQTITFGTNVAGSKNVFIGFRILLSDGFHYGWMQLKMDVVMQPMSSPSILKTTLINYAYKKAPNQNIKAGIY